MKLLLLIALAFATLSANVSQDAYSQFINELKTSNKSDLHKVNEVNKFFNKFKYRTDASLYGKEDYWATPEEFLANKGGDCEDFAIAKFFALKEIGFDMSKVSFTYGNIKKEAHMVLIVKIKNANIVLDNYVKKLTRLDKRPDFKAVYSFNADFFWAGVTAKKLNVNKFSKWTSMISKMNS